MAKTQKAAKTVNAEPLAAYHFEVVLDSESLRYPVRSCSGLSGETTIHEIEEGGNNNGTVKIPGVTKYPNLVLGRVLCSANTELYKLFVDATDSPSKSSKIKLFSGRVNQLGANGSVVASWRFTDGWVCKWQGPELEASKNELSMERVEIAHQGLEAVG